MLTHINTITEAGINIQNIANNVYNKQAIEKATLITEKVKFEPYIVGDSSSLYR